ncbi:MAG: UDP-2,3-diacylglucosamine diphosphatase [Cytophagales bacterium]|nr:UDP-2,3-diacylglucosamine diphosphatase [Rhizobacter sp.]
MPVEVHAEPEWRCIDFISDLHLGADTPKTFEAWSNYLRDTTAEAVFILGDLFEVWVGDDARLDGFEARCAQVLTDATQRRRVGFMAGNRDFLVGNAMLAACSVTPLPDPCVLIAFDQRVLLTHGDALCLADTDYQQFRAMVRSPQWQAQFLAQPLDARQRYARDVRAHSEMRKKDMHSPADWADVDRPSAIAWLHESGSRTMIHGHTHRPATQALDATHTRHVLSDWDLDHPPHRAEVLRWTAQGFNRLSLAAASG